MVPNFGTCRYCETLKDLHIFNIYTVMYSSYATSTIFFIIRMYAFVKDAYYTFHDNINALYIKLRRAFSKQQYVFFQYITSPYNVLDVNISAPSCALPLWYYIPKNRVFISCNPPVSVENTLTSNARGNPLPILSMQIIENEAVVFDLTDFLSSIKVYPSALNTCPPVAHILGAWTLSSRIVLDRGRSFIVRLIDINAKEYETDVCETRNILTDHISEVEDSMVPTEPTHIDSSEQEDDISQLNPPQLAEAATGMCQS